MNNINLYDFIKQKSQEKGRPLKIICDWDECLSPYRPYGVYKFSKIYNESLLKAHSFSEFFNNFWEEVVIENTVWNNQKAKDLNYIGNSPEKKEFIEKFAELKKLRRAERKKGSDKYKELDSLDGTPFLSIAEELMSTLKEGLVNKLVVCSSTRSKINKPSANYVWKQKQFAKTFGKFPNCEMKIWRADKARDKKKPCRREIIQNEYPDFDIFIDDNPKVIGPLAENLSSPGKIFAMPDYKFNRHIQNPSSFHVKQKVSNITNRDFALGSLEYRTNKLEQGIKALKQKSRPSSPTLTWLIVFPVISLVLAWLVWRLVWKRKQSSN